jgi:hypothetical protein
MATAETIASMSNAADRAARGLTFPLIALIRAGIAKFGHRYHPERHYMRGPGPKWHAKHDRPAVETDQSGPGLGQAA